MDQRPFGPTGKRVARIGQGTWKMEEDERSAAIAALRLGIDLGMTHIDTAELYGAGRVEELVGEAIAGRRDDVFLVSKVLPDNASREGTIAACERSLKRLRTEWLDCYLLHWPSHHRLEETIAAFEHLREQGKIRSWGLSNFDEHELGLALAIAGPNRIACNQVLYHLRERSIEHAVLPYCAANGIAVVGYTPFGRSSFPPGGTSGKALQKVADSHPKTRAVRHSEGVQRRARSRERRRRGARARHRGHRDARSRIPARQPAQRSTHPLIRRCPRPGALRENVPLVGEVCLDALAFGR